MVHLSAARKRHKCDNLCVSFFKRWKILKSQTDLHISGERVRKSLFAACMTGDEGKKLIVSSLESKGLILDAKHQYKLAEIKTHFDNLFGERLASIIFTEVKSHLSKEDLATN